MRRSNSLKKLAKLVNDDDFADDLGDVEWTATLPARRPLTRTRSEHRSRAESYPIARTTHSRKLASNPLQRSINPIATLSSSADQTSPPVPSVPAEHSAPPVPPVQTKVAPVAGLRSAPPSPAPLVPALETKPVPVHTLKSSPLAISSAETKPAASLVALPKSLPSRAIATIPEATLPDDDFGDFGAPTAPAADAEEFDDFLTAPASAPVAGAPVDEDEFGNFSTFPAPTPPVRLDVGGGALVGTGERGKIEDAFDVPKNNVVKQVTANDPGVFATLENESAVSTAPVPTAPAPTASPTPTAGNPSSLPPSLSQKTTDDFEFTWREDDDPSREEGGFGSFDRTAGGAGSDWGDEDGGEGGYQHSEDGDEDDGFERGMLGKAGSEMGEGGVMGFKRPGSSSGREEGDEFGGFEVVRSTGKEAEKKDQEEDVFDEFGAPASVATGVDNMFSDFGAMAGNGGREAVGIEAKDGLSGFGVVGAEAPDGKEEGMGEFDDFMASAAAPAKEKDLVGRGEQSDNFDGFDDLGTSVGKVGEDDDGDGFGDSGTSMGKASANGDGFGDFDAPAKDVGPDDNGFSEFDAPVGKMGAADDGLGEFGVPSRLTGVDGDGFEGFSAPVTNVAVGNDVFGDFDTKNMSVEDDDGFGDFGAPAGVDTGGADDFDDFAPPVKASGKAALKDDGFGDFESLARGKGDTEEDEFGGFGGSDDDGFGEFDGPGVDDEDDDRVGGPALADNDDENKFGGFGDRARDDASEEEHEFGSSFAARRGRGMDNDDGFDDDDGWGDNDDKPVMPKAAAKPKAAPKVVEQKRERPPLPSPLTTTMTKVKKDVPVPTVEEVLAPNMDWTDKSVTIQTWARLLKGIYPTSRGYASTASVDPPGSIKDLVLNAHESLHAKLTWTAVTRSMDSDDGVPKVVWKASKIETLYLDALGYRRRTPEGLTALSLQSLQESPASSITASEVTSPTFSSPGSFSPVPSPRESQTNLSNTTSRTSRHQKTTSTSSFSRAFSSFSQKIAPTSVPATPTQEKPSTNTSTTSLSSSSTSSPARHSESRASIDSLDQGLFPSAPSERSLSPAAISPPVSRPAPKPALAPSTQGSVELFQRTASQTSTRSFPILDMESSRPESPVVRTPTNTAQQQLVTSPQPAHPDAWLSTNDMSFLAAVVDPSKPGGRMASALDEFDFGDLVSTAPSAPARTVSASLLSGVGAATKMAPGLQAIVDRLPDLKYMRAKVIMFPVDGGGLLGADTSEGGIGLDGWKADVLDGGKAGGIGLGIVEGGSMGPVGKGQSILEEDENEWGGWAG